MSTTTPYPQAAPLTDDELRTFLHEAQIATLGSHNEDGSIHLAPLWFRYDEPTILLGTQAICRKVRNVERDPRVTVLVEVPQPALIGAMIYGHADIDRAQPVQHRASIFSRYMPADEAQAFAERLAGTWDPVIIRVTPERVVTFDYRKGFPG